MVKVQDGQCGTCAYFGAEHANDQKLVKIRISHQADADLVEPCGHPENQQHSLRVTPVSGCAEYKRAVA